ncbi:pre-mRNA cleavage complex 2 protein Pcf11 [Pseudohyphozyma bogoriensis]|nr:pre-mRNA cleavage complex 2 protein Pcf11 [Pseudohyphozyma bogoriensis]
MYPPQHSHHAQQYSNYPHANPYDAYGPPPPAPHHQPSAADDFRAPPEVGLDPNACRRFFSYHLATLTYNSKPAITNLTLFAHQHATRMSAVIADCLEQHLKTCPPPNRLPAMYLLDSISKNIGPPYVVLFTRFIERVYLSAYHVVDASTKTKMEELLGTWRTGGADGGELFRSPEEMGSRTGGRVQRGIETALFGPGGRGGGIGGGGRAMRDSESYQSGVQQLPSAANRDERSGVLFDVRRLLQLRQEQAQLHPDDAVNNSQIVALQKLEALVTDTQLTSDQVSQIRSQLANLAPAPTPIESPAPSQIPTPSGGSTPLPLNFASGPSNGHTPQLQSQTLPVPALSVPGFDLDPAALAQLQHALAGGGGASLFAAVAGAGAGEVKKEVKEEEEGGRGPKGDMRVREYEEALLGLEFETVISTADIMKPRPNLASFLYDRFPDQCTQCGLRFIDSKAGKAAKDRHLDWHFTHKRRIREGVGRAQGRSWFSLEEDWLKSDTVDVNYESAETSGSGAAGSSKAGGSGNGGIDRAALMKRKVPLPTDPTEASRVCPICKEGFKSELDEEDEEWVWTNAEVVDGVRV